MKRDIDHLPLRQQEELALIKQILLDEFDAALKSGGGGTQSWHRDGRVLKIILFGSYARNDWVDERLNGYQSDFDLLIIVNHEKLTDIADYWYVAEDKILRDQRVDRTVNIIVHTMQEVGQGLTKGDYFWSDIIRDGVALHELEGHAFPAPKPITTGDALAAAEQYFAQWMPKVAEALAGAEFYVARGNVRDASFLLHQATERVYACLLLVYTFYFPRSHNIKFLRSLAESLDKSLISAWPRDQRVARRRFELLKRSYVEARYADQFDMTLDDLSALTLSLETLSQLVEASCRVRIAELEAAANVQPA